MKLYYCKIPKSIKLFGVLLNYDAKKCGGGGGGGGGVESTVISDFISMGESFLGLLLNSGFWGWLSIERQPQKLNSAGNNSFSDLVYLKVFNLDFLLIWRHTASFKFWFSKVQDFGNFELSPMH